MCRFFFDLDLVHVFSKKITYKIFNISFESTQNKQQYGTKITCTERGQKKVMVIKKKKCYNF